MKGAKMKMCRAPSILLLSLLLILLPLALAACGGGGEEEQQADKQAQQREEEMRQREETPAQQGEQGEQGEEPVEELSEEQQADKAAEEMAEIHQQFQGQMEIFPGAMPDTSAAAVRVKEAASADWILFTEEPQDRVVRFYERALRRMRDLDKEETPSRVVFYFSDNRGQSVRLEVVQAGSGPQDGTYIIVAAG